MSRFRLIRLPGWQRRSRLGCDGRGRSGGVGGCRGRDDQSDTPQPVTWVPVQATALKRPEASSPTGAPSGACRCHGATLGVVAASAPTSTDDAPVADAVRFFFVTTDGAHRQFLRFMGVGEDIYWGPPGRGPLHESNSSMNDDGKISITVGAEVKVSSTKVSYHASGQVHVKDDGEMQGDPMWQVPPASAVEPVLVGILLTKVPMSFPEYRKKLPDQACVNFILDSESEQRRQSLELWLTPPGAHTFPGGSRRPPDFGTTVTPSLIVCGWLDPCDETLSSWHPDKSILIVTGR